MRGQIRVGSQDDNDGLKARFKNPAEPVTSGFLIEGHKYQYFESTSTLLDLYWIFESTSEHLRKS